MGKIPWRREKLPTPVFLPGEVHGQRSLGGYIHGDTESDTTERRTLHAGLHRAWSVCCVYGFVFRQIQEVSGRIPCSALQPTCSLLLLQASGDCPVAVTHAEAVCLFFSVCSPLLRWSRLYCFICESPDSFLHPHFVITSIHSGQ